MTRAAPIVDPTADTGRDDAGRTAPRTRKATR